MSYTWFKLHHDLPGDIKLRRFTPQEKWAWVALLCLASQSHERGVIDADDEDIADYCEFSTTQDWLYYRDKLITKGMAEHCEGGYRICNWRKRQNPDNPYGRLPAHEWGVIRDEIFRRDNYTCQYCGATDNALHCDHVMPISRGGSNEYENLTTACVDCNRRKYNKTVEEWLGGESHA